MSDNGKLLVYASKINPDKDRLEHISDAAEKMGKILKLNVEVVTFGEEFTPIYVYYKNGDEEPIPIYCDKDGKSDMQEICKTLRNMIFVLSFHPRHSALKQFRQEIMRFS